jgi:glycosyltransferase involved in cell wall biosynthesis
LRTSVDADSAGGVEDDSVISVVLPCLNEVRHGYLPKIVANLAGQQGDTELIAVVSPCEDETLDILQQSPNIQVIEAPAAKNRAQRFNIGIAASQGDVVLLHHPATLLPEREAIALLEKAFQDPLVRWSGFRHQFDLDHWLLQYTSWYSNTVRPRWGRILYCDHCVAVRRSLLLEIGGVPDMDIFEDTALSHRLGRYGRPWMLPATVVTSARRYRGRGVYCQALLNQTLKLMYYLNLDPHWMNQLYEKKAQINVSYQETELP